MVSLDMEKGGEIAKNLLSLYTYIKKEIFTANINKDPKPIENVVKYLAELQEAWVSIDSTKVNNKQALLGKVGKVVKNNSDKSIGSFAARG